METNEKRSKNDLEDELNSFLDDDELSGILSTSTSNSNERSMSLILEDADALLSGNVDVDNDEDVENSNILEDLDDFDFDKELSMEGIAQSLEIDNPFKGKDDAACRSNSKEGDIDDDDNLVVEGRTDSYAKVVASTGSPRVDTEIPARVEPNLEATQHSDSGDDEEEDLLWDVANDEAVETGKTVCDIRGTSQSGKCVKDGATTSSSIADSVDILDDIFSSGVVTPSSDSRPSTGGGSSEHLEAVHDQLKAARCDMDKLRALCIAGGVPNTLRSSVWSRLLMRTSGRDIDDEEGGESEDEDGDITFDDKLYRTCRVVADQVWPSWKSEDVSQVAKNMAQILTRQYQNHELIIDVNKKSEHADAINVKCAWLCVPFVVPELRPPLRRAERAVCFEDFCFALAPLFVDRNLYRQHVREQRGHIVGSSEKCYFKLLLAYHEPSLYRRLNEVSYISDDATSYGAGKDDGDASWSLLDEWVEESLGLLFVRSIASARTKGGTCISPEFLRWMDSLIVHADPTPTWRHYICLAVLLQNRNHLLQSDAKSLTRNLQLLVPTASRDSTCLLLQSARAIESSTPLTFRRILERALEDGDSGKDKNAFCVRVTAPEVIMSLGTQRQQVESGDGGGGGGGGDKKKRGPSAVAAADIRYFVVDCRCREHRSCQSGWGSLEGSFSVDPEWVCPRDSTSRLENALKGLKPLIGKAHICLVGSWSTESSLLQGLTIHGSESDGAHKKNVRSGNAATLRRLAVRLIEMGFPYVSTVEGGFRSIAQYLATRKELAKVVGFRVGPDAGLPPAKERTQRRERSSPKSGTSRNSDSGGSRRRAAPANKSMFVLSSAAAGAMERRSAPSSGNRNNKNHIPVTIGSILDDDGSLTESLEQNIKETTQNALKSMKNLSTTVGTSARSTWGALRSRWARQIGDGGDKKASNRRDVVAAKVTGSTRDSSETEWKVSIAKRAETTTKLIKEGWSSLFSSSSSSSSFSHAKAAMRNDDGARPKATTPRSDRPVLTQEEKSAVALEQHRLSGLCKGERLAVSKVRNMCVASMAGPSAIAFEVVKMKRIDGLSGHERLPRVLLVAAHRLISLELDTDASIETGTGNAYIKSNHHLTELKKLSFSKKDPHLVSVFLKRLDGGRTLKKNVYRMKRARDFIREVMRRLKDLRG